MISALGSSVIGAKCGGRERAAWVLLHSVAHTLHCAVEKEPDLNRTEVRNVRIAEQFLHVSSLFFDCLEY